MRVTILALLILVLISTGSSFYHHHHRRIIHNKSILMTTDDVTSSSSSSTDITVPEKLAEIEERKAAEVFITRNTGRFECQACGYIYDEAVGLPKKGIVAGTIFADIEKFRCPQCGVGKSYFVAETETLSGFKENQKYGLGGNSMTGNQKTNIIFGGLLLFFALFMSGYLLE